MAIAGRGYPNPPVIGRGSLADAPVLTTPAPVTVAAQPDRRWLAVNPPVVSVAPQAQAAAPAASTPQPVVVAAAVKLAATQPPVILRNTLADPPVLTTPAPIVVAAPVRFPPTFPVISSAPFIPPPPPFSVGKLTAGTQALAGTMTAATQALGGPS